MAPKDPGPGLAEAQSRLPSSAQLLTPHLHNGSSAGVNHKLNHEEALESHAQLLRNGTLILWHHRQSLAAKDLRCKWLCGMLGREGLNTQTTKEGGRKWKYQSHK